MSTVADENVKKGEELRELANEQINATAGGDLIVVQSNQRLTR